MRLLFSFVIFENLTPPSILDNSVPFAIRGVSIKTGYPFHLLMTHTEPQLPTLRNHRATVSKSQI